MATLTMLHTLTYAYNAKSYICLDCDTKLDMLAMLQSYIHLQICIESYIRFQSYKVIHIHLNVTKLHILTILQSYIH